MSEQKVVELIKASPSKWTIIISLIIIIVLIVFVLKSASKRSKSSREELRTEIQSYFNNRNDSVYIYSGEVTVGYYGITYARGNKRVTFKVPIKKETILAPVVIKSWFENRNYNEREATIILTDIKHYLITNKYCSNVQILSDEEYVNTYNIFDIDL